MLRRALFAVFPLALALAQPVHAQVQFPVPPPELKVGEVARYATIDLWNNRQLSATESQLVEIQAERLVVRTKRSDQAEFRTVLFTRDWQPCRSMQGSDVLVCDGALKFPLQPGGKMRYDKLPWPNGQGHSSAECEVKGEEKLTVAAGTFDTVKVECAGFWNRLFGNTSSGRQVEAYWYAPKIGRFVRSQYTDYNSAGGGIVNKTQTDLVEFVGK